MNVTKQLAEHAAGLRHADLPAEVQRRARMFVLDGLGIMVGAVDFARVEGDRCLEDYLDMTAPPGPATVIGTRRKTTPMMAAFANGTLSEVLDNQDTNIAARIHNGSAIIPAALAMGEVLGSNGADVLAAIVAGYEVGSRLGMATQPEHWYHGFQITGTYNTCGAAATAGRLMGFDAAKMANALGISGYIIPVSNGDNVFKGYSIKPIHGGQPACNGLSAAYLAKAGYEGGPLEGEPPRYHAPLRILGCPEPRLEECVKGIGSVWHCLEAGYKPFPVGLFINGPVEIALDLLRENPFSASAIDRVQITTYHDGRKFTGEKYTTVHSNYVDAHLSMAYCVAVALTDGAMTPRQLARSRLRDPAVHELASRVKCVESEAMNRQYPHEWPVEVAVHLKDGSVRRKHIDQVKWSPRRPPAWDEMCEKFRILSEPVLGAARVRQAIEFVGALEKQQSVTPLLEMVRPAP